MFRSLLCHQAQPCENRLATVEAETFRLLLQPREALPYPPPPLKATRRGACAAARPLAHFGGYDLTQHIHEQREGFLVAPDLVRHRQSGGRGGGCSQDPRDTFRH